MVKVLLTGASGFIATHVFKILLDKGFYVVGTVRSQEKASWLDKIFSAQNSSYEIEFVEDISTDGSFDEVFKKHSDIKYVIHTASPFFRPSSDPEKTILKPAIKGTTNILKAIKQHAPQVEHVVITSSFAAILNHYLEGGFFGDPSYVYSEKSWSALTYEESVGNLDLTYNGSKNLAERAFWKFIKEENVNFSGTSINPPYVFGPMLQEVKVEKDLNTSNGVLYKLLRSRLIEKVENSVGIAVDVRDAALAHVLAIEKKQAIGQRWFVTSDYFTSYGVLQLLKKNFPELKTAQAPSDYDEKKFLVGAAKIDNHLTNEQSGIQYIPIEETLKDTFKDLIRVEKIWSSQVATL